MALFSGLSKVPADWKIEGQLNSASHRIQLGEKAPITVRAGPALVLIGPREAAKRVPIVLHRSKEGGLDLLGKWTWKRKRLSQPQRDRVCLAPSSVSTAIYAIQRCWAFVTTDVMQHLPQNYRPMLRTENLPPVVLASKGLSKCDGKRLQALLQSLNVEERAQSVLAETGFRSFVASEEREQQSFTDPAVGTLPACQAKL
ncbi:MAG: hypothetical protein GY822_16115 [Deltaproteobacteria bacterium]|nr:hypothetical protein [Deltaproteobacteria bacterium]